MEHGWIGLLRAINLGPRNKVPMAGLREVLAAEGCAGVRTYIQSGNAVFRSAEGDRDALRARLERAVAEAFGVETTVILRTFAELERVVSSHPFGADTSKTAVSFLASAPADAAVRALSELEIAPERFVVAGADVFLHYPNGLGRSTLTGALLEKRLGVQGTIRNWRTVTALAELARADA